MSKRLLVLIGVGLVAIAAAFVWRVCQDRARQMADLNTALFEAIESSDMKTVKSLLDKGASVNARDAEWGMPLHSAARKGDVAIAKLLLERGADVNAHAVDWTPLHSAATYGDLEMVELLIAHGANVNANTSSFSTPLVCAAGTGRQRIVELLVSKGADINLKGIGIGTTPLLMAAGYDQVETARWLRITERTPNSASKGGTTPLSMAGGHENDEMIDLLLAHGADYTSHVAASRGELAKLRELLSRGADPNAQDEQGRPALYYAISKDKVAAAKVLIAAGADAKVQLRHGGGLLGPAASLGSEDMVRLLIEAGANVNVRNKWQLNKTPLDAALSRKHDKVAEILRAHGAKTSGELKGSTQ